MTEQQRERQWQADTLGITENQPGPQPLWKTDMEHTPSGAKHPQSISVVGKTSTEALVRAAVGCWLCCAGNGDGDGADRTFASASTWMQKAQILRGRDSESRKD